MIPPSSDQLTVIFDGTCGFCTAIRARIERWDRHGRIHWLPCQQVPIAGGARRLCDETIVAITPEGLIDTGARAAARILAAVTGTHWPHTIATLPVICPLLSLAYRGVAAIRHHLPGVTPWCEEHPEECRPVT
jgi:predicted DCC family thiol-disulfide oxidoreductase YuxK